MCGAHVPSARSTRDDKSLEGRLGLQFNQGPIKFRKLLVREL